jgi:flagellar motor switch protein FliM
MAGTELATRDSVAMRAEGIDAVRPEPKTSWMMRIEDHRSWETLAQLRVTMRAEVALNQFKIRDLLMLKAGQVFETVASATEDVSVKVGQMQLGWSEFEVHDQRMALRLTRLS